MKRAIVYRRVSTDEQSRYGTSLESQLDIVEKYANATGIKIEKIFTEDYSGKNFDRPEWEKLNKYLRENKSLFDCLIVSRWDRFSRNVELAYTELSRLKRLGIQVIAAEQLLDTTVPEYKLILAFYLSLPEVDNDRRAKVVKDGMIKRMEQGQYPFPLPKGYYKDKNTGKVLHDEFAEVVKMVFTRIHRGDRIYQVRADMEKLGFKLSPSYIGKLLRNPLYSGWIVNPLLQKPIQAAFPAIVKETIFYSVQNILSNNKSTNKSEATPEFYLKGSLKCPKCGRNLTGYSVTKKQKLDGSYRIRKTPHIYYKCSNTSCRVSLSAKKVHEQFENGLKELQLLPMLQEPFSKILKDVFSELTKEHTNQVKRLRAQHTIVIKKLEKLKDKYIYDDLDKKLYEDEREKLLRHKFSVELEISNLDSTSNPIKFIDNVVKLVVNLPALWSKLRIKDRQALQNLIYPNGLIYNKKSDTYLTPTINQIFAYIGNISKKASNNADFSTVAVHLVTMSNPWDLPEITLNDFISLANFIEEQPIIMEILDTI